MSVFEWPKGGIPVCVEEELGIEYQIVNSVRKMCLEGLSLHWLYESKWLEESIYMR